MVYQCALWAEKKNATYGNSVGNIIRSDAIRRGLPIRIFRVLSEYEWRAWGWFSGAWWWYQVLRVSTMMNWRRNNAMPRTRKVKVNVFQLNMKSQHDEKEWCNKGVQLKKRWAEVPTMTPIIRLNVPNITRLSTICFIIGALWCLNACWWFTILFQNLICA